MLILGPLVVEGDNETGEDALIEDNESTLPVGDVLGFGALAERGDVMKDGVGGSVKAEWGDVGAETWLVITR